MKKFNLMRALFFGIKSVFTKTIVGKKYWFVGNKCYWGMSGVLQKEDEAYLLKNDKYTLILTTCNGALGVVKKH